ncbi:MAG: CehA/McbA family metallohydrolase [Planctomycetota bacterium]
MVTLISPYDPAGRLWLRGQLHTHTTRSDGARDPQTTIDAYAALGYDFLMLSDHDTLGTVAEFDGRGMLLIPGNEISNDGPHMLHVDARSFVPPDADRQKVINAVAADGGFTVCNHPNWQEHFNHFPQALLERLDGYAGLEIYNGVIRRLYGLELATDRWDMLLSKGRKLWGYGNDDSHHDIDTGLAWNVAWVKERTAAAVVEALRTGSFYASSGVCITGIRVWGDNIGVTAPGAQKMIVTGLHGRRIQEQAGGEIVYRVRDEDHGYIRVTAVGGPDQYAFIQPFFIIRTQPGLATGELISHRMAWVDRPLKLDGNRGDAAWNAIKPFESFVDMRSAKPSPFTPDTRLATDGRTLFVSILCPEPDPAHMKVQVKENGQVRLWTDDGVELFIDPTGRRKNYLQFLVNSAGFWHSIGMGGRPAAAVPITVKAGRREFAYLLEIAIPLTALGEDVSLSAPWAFNISRNRYGPPVGHCQWAFTAGTNHSPHLFGTLDFTT